MYDLEVVSLWRHYFWTGGLAYDSLLLQHWLRYFKKSVSVIIFKLGGLNPKAFKSIVLLNMLGKLIEKIIAR